MLKFIIFIYLFNLLFIFILAIFILLAKRIEILLKNILSFVNFNYYQY